jgi:hypothetical protein
MNQSFVQVVGSGSKSIQDFFLLEYTIRYENGSHLAVVGYLPIIDTVMGMSPPAPPGKYPFLSVLAIAELKGDDLLRTLGGVEHDQIELIVPKPAAESLLWDLQHILDLHQHTVISIPKIPGVFTFFFEFDRFFSIYS